MIDVFSIYKLRYSIWTNFQFKALQIRVPSKTTLTHNSLPTLCKLFKIWFQFLWKLDHLSAKHLKLNGLGNLFPYWILNFIFRIYLWREIAIHNFILKMKFLKMKTYFSTFIPLAPKWTLTQIIWYYYIPLRETVFGVN